MISTCRTCGELIKDYASRKRKYCSIRCMSLAFKGKIFSDPAKAQEARSRKSKIQKKCPACGTIFTVTKSRNRKYCSPKCYYELLKNNIPWNKGLKGIHLSPASEFKEGNIPWWMEKRLPNPSCLPEVRKERSKNTEKWWKDPEYVKKQMEGRGIHPNKKEVALDALLQHYFPNEWDYVGDGDFVVDGLCPDWKNRNGKRKLIELFGCFYHGCPIHNPKYKPKRRFEASIRQEVFSKQGFDLLVIWEHELSDEMDIVKRVDRFAGD